MRYFRFLGTFLAVNYAAMYFLNNIFEVSYWWLISIIIGLILSLIVEKMIKKENKQEGNKSLYVPFWVELTFFFYFLGTNFKYLITEFNI